MLFKQIQLFQFKNATPSLEMLNQIEELSFSPCSPASPFSMGWTAPIEDSTKLVRNIQGYLVFCLKIEEKILPSIVVNQALQEAIKQMENSENRKLRQKEKYELKEQIIQTLLPRAFSRFSHIFAYIDTQHKRLILNTTNAKRVDQFLSLFKKSIECEFEAMCIENVSSTMTQWLLKKNYPNSLGIEKACLLQDPKLEKRVIRCKEQDLFANGIQSLIKDGCEIIQLAINWLDKITFTLSSDFLFSNIQFHDDVLSQIKDIAPESKEQEFDADILIMASTFASLLAELMMALQNSKQPDSIYQAA